MQSWLWYSFLRIPLQAPEGGFGVRANTHSSWLRPSPPRGKEQNTSSGGRRTRWYTTPLREVFRLFLLHHILHTDRSGDWWLQFQVRPSSDAFASFRSAGVNALADDFFKVRALFFYASYMSQVMPFCSTRNSMHGHTYHLRIHCQQGCPEPSHSFINTSIIAAVPFVPWIFDLTTCLSS